jgi:hypothetical protein
MTCICGRKKRLKRDENLGYTIGGAELGNKQLEFEAGFSDALAGKRHIKKPKKRLLFRPD